MRGIVQLGSVLPKDLREWDQILRTLNLAVQVDGEGNVVFAGTAPNTLPFITVGNTSLLSNERSLAVTSELTLTDNGPGSSVQLGVGSSIARDVEVAAAITAHEGASDPHPTYMTAAEVAAAITAHEGASNPHPTYLTEAEGDARYLLQSNVLNGSKTFDPASLADGAGDSTNVTVTGAVLGDFALASFSLDTQSLLVSASVTAADTVTVRFQNETGGGVDLGSGTLRVRVWKQ